jgi:hypothetical protein
MSAATRCPICGAERPHDRDELLEIGRLFRDRRYHAAGARLFESALREDPGLDGDGASPHRYEAACLAALAGSTTGADDPPPDEAGRTRFRGLALRRLEAELAAISRHLDADPTRNGEAVSGWLEKWRNSGPRRRAIPRRPGEAVRALAEGMALFLGRVGRPPGQGPWPEALRSVPALRPPPGLVRAWAAVDAQGDVQSPLGVTPPPKS